MFGWGSNRHAVTSHDSLDTLIRAAQQHEDQRITRLQQRFAIDDDFTPDASRFLAEVHRAFPHLVPFMRNEVPGFMEMVVAGEIRMTIRVNWEEEAWWIDAFGLDRFIPLDAKNCEDRLLLVLRDFRNVYWRDYAPHPVVPSR